MLARSGARSSILWHLWPAMAVLVSIELSFLSISILGMSKYLESRKSRSSNEYRNLNLRPCLIAFLLVAHVFLGVVHV